MKDTSTATERVGRYQLLEPIGGGPNGSVSRAKVFGVAGFERQFAVKRFHADLTAGPAAQALSSAARSYGSLEHPRIARMSEFGVAQGQTFTAVEYVAGLDVFRLLQEAKLASVGIAAGGALALVSQAARAVGYAHGRGLSHLGLAPTNVIVTADGDVKVTDFGILAATMPARPAEAHRLASRVPYLAPEQIAGEATSAATDVFVLGVIAYELVTGQRAYRGESPAQIAQAILAGPPSEPTLPRPIVRVLQRCLARSPFERFPDARALADALDAALRVAPVPGTRKDVGAQVKTTLERYAQLNEGNVSGMVALGSNLSSAPTHDDISTQPVATRRPEARTEPSPMPTFTPQAGTPIPRMSGLSGSSASTVPTKDLMKPTSTIPGMAAPPIPVPPGVVPPPGASTIPGVTGKKPMIPAFPKPGAPPARPTPPPAPTPGDVPAKVGSLTQSWDAVSDPPLPVPAKVGSLTQGWDAIMDPTTEGEVPSMPPAPGPLSGPTTIPDPIASISDEPQFELPDEPRLPTTQNGLAPVEMPRGRARGPTPGHNFDSTTGEMSRAQLEALNRKAQLSTNEMPPLGKSEMNRANDAITKPVNIASMPIEASASDSLDFAPEPSQVVEPPPSATMPSFSPPPPAKPISQPAIAVPSTSATGMAPSTSRPELASAPAPVSPATRPPAPPTKTKLPLVAGIVLGIGVLGAGGYIAYDQLIAKKDDTTTVAMGGSNTTGSNDPNGSAGSNAMPSGSNAAGSNAAGSDGSNAAGSNAAGSDGSNAAGSDGSNGSAMTAGSNGSAEGSGSATGSAEGSGSAGSAAGTAAGSAEGSGSAAVANAGSNTPNNAGSNADNNGGGNAPEVKPSGKSDQLEVVSTPPGARVFLDGADQGKSPLKLPGTGDRHTLAVLLPDHDLYIAEVDGAGVYNITLAPVKMAKSGPGIKIEKCKAKGRYYIYVDGQPSGQTCPTAKRIVTTLGNHVVEVYDIVTESRKKYDVSIVDDRLSVRVKIDE